MTIHHMQIQHCAIQWKHYNSANRKTPKTVKSAEIWMGYEILLSPYEVQWNQCYDNCDRD